MLHLAPGVIGRAVAVALTLMFGTAATAQGTAAGPERRACQPVQEVPQALRQLPLVIFGEIHGTREAPAFVADYVCAQLTAGRAITLALEIDEREQAALDSFLASEGGSDAESRLMSGPHWQSDTPDGRSSQAMFELLETLRRARVAGHDVRIAAIDAWPRDEARDAAQARRVRALVQAGTRQIVLLIGNVHAMREPLRAGAPVPMASYLNGLDFVTLNLRSPGGTAWGCQARRDCGPRAMRGLPRPLGPEWGIELGRSMFAPGFDGQWHVPSLTASPPAARRDLGSKPTS